MCSHVCIQIFWRHNGKQKAYICSNEPCLSSLEKTDKCPRAPNISVQMWINYGRLMSSIMNCWAWALTCVLAGVTKATWSTSIALRALTQPCHGNWLLDWSGQVPLMLTKNILTKEVNEGHGPLANRGLKRFSASHHRENWFETTADIWRHLEVKLRSAGK